MALVDTKDRKTHVAPRRRAGRPSINEAQKLERAVLDAALAEFRVHGYSGASIERIAAMAGVTRSAVYRRYGGRLALFQLVLDSQIALLQRQAEGLNRTATDPVEALRRTAQAYCRFVVSPVALDLQRIVIWEAAASDPSAIPRVPALPIDLSDPIDRLIAQAQACGKLPTGPVDLWRDTLLRLVAEGPRWQALTSGMAWDDRTLMADFDRMWGVFMTLAENGRNV